MTAVGKACMTKWETRSNEQVLGVGGHTASTQRSELASREEGGRRTEEFVDVERSKRWVIRVSTQEPSYPREDRCSKEEGEGRDGVGPWRREGVRRVLSTISMLSFWIGGVDLASEGPT